MALPCNEMVDNVQARVGRTTASEQLIDPTYVTRNFNSAQQIIVETIPKLPTQTFKNTDSLDTTGTFKYALSDITVGDSSTANRICRVTDVWYLDGNESRHLTYMPPDEFDAEYPDLTHADNNFDKPRKWTQRDNVYIETYPYCGSSYWDKDMRFDGDFYPADFTTDSTELSDLSGADEGLTLYAVWQSWMAIGVASPAVAAEIASAKKAWSNPEPLPGERLGWLEAYRRKHDIIIGWDSNLYG